MAKPREAAPIEAGAVETEMVDTSAPQAEPSGEPTPFPGQPMPPETLPTSAMLTGPQMAEIKVRNEASDSLQQQARASQAKATLDARAAQYAQEALTSLIGNLIGWHGLDPNHRYQVNLERGMIEDRGAVAPPTE